jgi:hypothetical protein
MHRADRTSMHEWMNRQNVDEDRRIEAEHPKAQAIALPKSTVQISSQHQKYTQQDSEGDEKGGVTRTEKAIQPCQERLSLGWRSHWRRFSERALRF